MFTLQENVRSLRISSVFRILKIPTPHFLPHSSHIWRRCPLLQYCYQTDAIFAAKQCRAALISVLQAHSENEVLTSLRVYNASDNYDVVPIQWQGEESFEVTSSVFVTSLAPELLQQAVGGKKYSPRIVYCIASVGRRLVTHKQSHQRNWPGTL